jgi:hypothetical protein
MSRQLISLAIIAMIAGAASLRPDQASAMRLSPGFHPGPIALNPQPLPPGFRFAARLHCYGVQRGDPRLRPPIRVCN